MTLILASVRPDDVVLTADGRSTTTTKGVITGINDHFQKLFPMPDHPVVIGNLGENRLDNKPLSEFLNDFMAQLNAGDLTIEQMADELRHFAHPAIRKRLKALNIANTRCGFWLAGFGAGDDHPRLVENFWVWKDNVLLCEERQFLPISVTEGGDGQKLIHPPGWEPVKGKSIDEVRAYHKSLMDEAINAKVEHNPVGGHVHELIITRAEWKWTQSPMPDEHESPSTRPTTRPNKSGS